MTTKAYVPEAGCPSALTTRHCTWYVPGSVTVGDATFDLARTRTGERPGSGLGLAITKWIAEAHGGSISASSRPGRGTTLTVVLPTTMPEPEGVAKLS